MTVKPEDLFPTYQGPASAMYLAYYVRTRRELAVAVRRFQLVNGTREEVFIADNVMCDWLEEQGVDADAVLQYRVYLARQYFLRSVHGLLPSRPGHRPLRVSPEANARLGSTTVYSADEISRYGKQLGFFTRYTPKTVWLDLALHTGVSSVVAGFVIDPVHVRRWFADLGVKMRVRYDRVAQR